MQSQQKHKNIIKRKILFLLFFIFLSNSFSICAQKEYVVVLDAGHGGKDPGNLGNGFKEKSIALKVVLKIGNYFDIRRQTGLEINTGGKECYGSGTVRNER